MNQAWIKLGQGTGVPSCPRLSWHLGMPGRFHTARLTCPSPVSWYAGPPHSALVSWPLGSHLFHPSGKLGMVKMTVCSRLCSRHSVDMHHTTLVLYLVQYYNATLKSPKPSSPPVTSQSTQEADGYRKAPILASLLGKETPETTIVVPQGYREMLPSRDQDQELCSMDRPARSRCSQLSAVQTHANL